MTKPRVHLIGQDGKGWAIDEDRRLLESGLSEVVELTGLEAADVVHACWWQGILELRWEQLNGKRVMCHMTGEPYAQFCVADLCLALPRVGLWIGRSRQAMDELQALRLPAAFVPYRIDFDVFRPIDDQAALIAARERWKLPAARYLIGSFQRDSEGGRLDSPKLVKGPDVFAVAVAEAQRRGVPVHVVLAGPRRHWLRGRLTELGVPYTFLGNETPQDDYPRNALSRADLNLLYNLLDLCLLTSRSEGGPHAVLESAAAGCAVLSTPVGIAPDILAPEAVVTTAPEAAERIVEDYRRHTLRALVGHHAARAREHCSAEAVAAHLAVLYADLDRVAPSAPDRRRDQMAPKVLPPRWRRALRRLLPRRPEPLLRVGVWHKFHKPPWGGGNQFLAALCGALRSRGVELVNNRYSGEIDVWLLNSIHFETDNFLRWWEQHPAGVVHRIDGPIQLVRGRDNGEDAQCYAINDQVATFTVLQSFWILRETIGLGFDPVRPVVIHNASDPELFHRPAGPPRHEGRRLRLISSSWSDNPRKGGPLYRFLDQHLDWSRYEYTFAGRASEPFERINQLPAVGSERLGDLLREHDIYITASADDPCSNAVVEALSCGLPVLYLDSGGHPELVQHGGLPFQGEDDVLQQLDRLAANLDLHRALCTPNTLGQVADRYLDLLRRAAERTRG